LQYISSISNQGNEIMNYIKFSLEEKKENIQEKFESGVGAEI
jgi:hypothetical protein